MDHQFNGYVFSTDKSKIQINQVEKLLKQTYWAPDRPVGLIEKSIENSMCFGIFEEERLVGFARVVTDHATAYYLCDVIIDEKHRRHGLGKELLQLITENEELKNLHGILITRDAHGLYEKYGFKKDAERLMLKRKS